MALVTANIVEIVKALREREVKGKSLCMLGRQQIYIDKAAFGRFLDSLSFPYDKAVYKNICESEETDTYEFFRMFGLKEVCAVDYTDMDRANIIFNLNSAELPEKLSDRFDYIIDGGTLEHVFDVPQALWHVANMLKAGGLIFHLSPCAGYVNHGFFSFSPTFFLDYYTGHGFTVRDIRFMSCRDHRPPEHWELSFSQDVRLFDGWEEINRFIDDSRTMMRAGRLLLFVTAEKRETGSGHRGEYAPIQSLFETMYADMERKGGGSQSDSSSGPKSKPFDMEAAMRWIGENKRVLLYCAGNVGKRVMQETYRRGNHDRIACIMDKDAEKIGENCCGLPIQYPTENLFSREGKILICSDRYDEEAYQQLTEQFPDRKCDIHKITDFQRGAIE